jgi:hypothetical protein
MNRLFYHKSIKIRQYNASMKTCADDNVLAQSIENECVSDPRCFDGDTSL